METEGTAAEGLDDDDEGDEDADRRALVSSLAEGDAVRLERWQSRRPAVDHLASGTMVDPGSSRVVPLFGVGDRVAVEQRSSWLAGAPWLRTVLGTVRSVEGDVVRVAPEDGDPRWVRLAVFSLSSPLTRWFLAPGRAGTDPFDLTAVRARELADLRALEAAERARAGLPKRGRGRPKGSRNRPRPA